MVGDEAGDIAGDAIGEEGKRGAGRVGTVGASVLRLTSRYSGSAGLKSYVTVGTIRDSCLRLPRGHQRREGDQRNQPCGSVVFSSLHVSTWCSEVWR